jgi:hypothetical protein
MATAFGIIQVCLSCISLALATLTINYYCDTIERLWLAMCHHRPGLPQEDVIILLNSDRLYPARWTCDWLQCYGCNVTDHPSDSCDLAASVFHFWTSLEAFGWQVSCKI